ncbi:hypothetical protein [Streptomyces sp. 5-6(2022)]|uniref:DUF6907 domain-containing protein n=1 Tax=Streptomyces sp. 5-6(2022) TaxID=2936510 RepID=UPI0023B8C185|nr:hypothetical protein [Streptomyces sp. 5-6(2022)]
MTNPSSCPPWCTGGHDSNIPEDVFHRSASVSLRPPSGSLPDRPSPSPRLSAYLMLPEVPEDDDPACIILDHGDVYGPYAQLDVEYADQMIRDLKTFTARMQQLRDQLAAAKKQPA